MSMTREEATDILKESKRQNEVIRDNPSTFWASHQMAAGVNNAKRRIEALDVALFALRPVSRERVEKVWRGYWEHDEISSEKSKTGKFLLPTCSCSKCGSYVQQEANFCPVCGDAKTDEAVEMVMERLEALHEADLI